jgi:hypothetical protein
MRGGMSVVGLSWQASKVAAGAIGISMYMVSGLCLVRTAIGGGTAVSRAGPAPCEVLRDETLARRYEVASASAREWRVGGGGST